MKNLLTVIMLCLLFCSCAKKFKVTECSQINDMSEKREQKWKKAILGSEVELTFYESSVRVTCHANDGTEDELVYNKVDENLYEWSFDEDTKTTLELHKILGFITSLRMVTVDEDQSRKITAKRDLW